MEDTYQEYEEINDIHDREAKVLEKLDNGDEMVRYINTNIMVIVTNYFQVGAEEVPPGIVAIETQKDKLTLHGGSTNKDGKCNKDKYRIFATLQRDPLDINIQSAPLYTATKNSP